ncbi:hypothetical protein [Haloechinothrix halophila]|uniref:hypothetical protein n=1 Tax=Haloechinothrix halophila TaxID=1069073 RepID=UPI00042159C8|nr:hypothetical protein [Haloechinothrix halophila]
MTALPGVGAVLRYTDAAAFADAPRGDWWPDDVEDFHDVITDVLHTVGDVIVGARAYAHGRPEIELRAAVVRIRAAPWAADPGDTADALLILGDGELTVLSYPNRAGAEAGFADHVAEREAAGAPYDYVTVPGHRRTAYLPDWPPAAPRTGLAWEASSRSGSVGTTEEGTVTITLDGDALLGIDLTTGRVLTWPDGERAETVARFPPIPGHHHATG